MDRQILTAKWLLPIDSDPIVNGELEIVNGVINYVGGRRADSKNILDLGDAILMPGLVNVHTHLEYTMLRGFLEDVEFFPWIRTLTAAKAHYQRPDWVTSATLGALECIQSGITTIGDNTDAGVTAEVAESTGLRARVYQEIFGIDHRDPVDAPMGKLKSDLASMSAFTGERVEIGVSPHAPYTVRPELLKSIAEYCESNQLRTSIHIAESQAEVDLIATNTGPFADMLARRGIEWSKWGRTPVEYLHQHGAINERTLAVHCVHTIPSDFEILASSKSAIAHCPKSNAKLGAGIAPLTGWLGIPGLNERVGIGTDSAVSNNTLDLFEEMRFALLTQRANSEKIVLSAKQMVETATIGGAGALGMDQKIGSLTVGKRADVIAVKLDNIHASPATDPYSAIVYSSRADDVCLTMIDGRILYKDHQFIHFDEAEIRNQAIMLRDRIAQGVAPV